MNSYKIALLLCLVSCRDEFCMISKAEEELAVEAFTLFVAPGLKHTDQIIWTQGDFTCAGVIADGCQTKGTIVVMCRSCVGDTALVHELLHEFLEGDGNHTSELWSKTIYANQWLNFKTGCPHQQEPPSF